jgi:hypothetical protein
MRATPLLVTALAIILGVATTALASGWSTASINLGTNANPVVSYSIVGNGYRGNITIVNYTALVLQSIKYDIGHRIPLNQTQLSFLVFLQALATQPTSKPSIVNVTIASTGAQPLGPYASYEVFLINATLSSPAPTLLYYPITVYFVGGGPTVTSTAYLTALPGTRFAIGYFNFMESASVCVDVASNYMTSPIAGYQVGEAAVVWYPSCNNSIAYTNVDVVVNVNGVNYTLSFTPYEGTSMVFPQIPSTVTLNVTAPAGSIGVFGVPSTTPLSLREQWFVLPWWGGGGVFYVPPGYELLTSSVYLTPTIYESMPAILMFPTQPGLYIFPNPYVIPPGGAVPESSFLVVYANVTGPSVVPKELFSISLPYRSCIWWHGMPINVSPLQLSGVISGGFLAQISGVAFMPNGVSALFSGVVAGYNTSEPSFVSAALSACDSRVFWALTPVTLNITLTDEYGYPVGYGLVTFGPNYSAWLVIVLAISAIGGGIYVLVTKLRGGRGEVVIRL